MAADAGLAPGFPVPGLHNAVRQHQVTCAVCTGPSPGHELCRPCQRAQQTSGLADATAFLAYAVAGRPSGRLMRGYKADPPSEADRAVVARLLGAGLDGHARCPAAVAGRPVTHWSVVPSLPARPGEHPLRRIAASLLAQPEAAQPEAALPEAVLPEAVLAAAARSDLPRTLSPRHYQAARPLPAGAHVLLIDDTWVSGGHAQSAALALHAAGAARVSLLVVARWLTRDSVPSQRLLRDLRPRPYDPARCPWTGASCPR